MTRSLAIVPVLVVGLAVSAAAQQVSEQDAWKAGESLLEAWNETSQQKDAAKQGALFTEDAIRVTPQGLMSGRAAIESAAAETFKDYVPDPSKLDKVTIIGNEIMLRAGSWSGKFKGAQVRGIGQTRMFALAIRGRFGS
jgi:Domain of unknown function (DUF4440)